MKKLRYKYYKKFVFNILVFLDLLIFSDAIKANYWPVFGTYRQEPGGRPEASGKTRSSLNTFPMNYVETFEKQVIKISKEIYMTV